MRFFFVEAEDANIYNPRAISYLDLVAVVLRFKSSHSQR